jgi:hypothetical protein
MESQIPTLHQQQKKKSNKKNNVNKKGVCPHCSRKTVTQRKSATDCLMYKNIWKDNRTKLKKHKLKKCTKRYVTGGGHLNAYVGMIFSSTNINVDATQK